MDVISHKIAYQKIVFIIKLGLMAHHKTFQAVQVKSYQTLTCLIDCFLDKRNYQIGGELFFSGGIGLYGLRMCMVLNDYAIIGDDKKLTPIQSWFLCCIQLLVEALSC